VYKFKCIVIIYSWFWTSGCDFRLHLCMQVLACKE
jgi:hypothetical protein